MSVAIDLSPNLGDIPWERWIGVLFASVAAVEGEEPGEAAWNDALQVTLRQLSTEVASHDHRISLEAYLRVIADLGRIGWDLEYSGDKIVGHKPELSSAREAKRAQLLAARSTALRDSAVRSFIRGMERDRKYDDRVCSIFSLMRDGRDLASAIEEADEKVASVVQPYVTVLSEGARCPHTGFELKDIWRYFRLTWTNPPRSIPSRQLRFLVRDAGADFHPIMGIGELSGAAIRVSARDQYIGWDPGSMEEWMMEEDDQEIVQWIKATINLAESEVYAKDLPSIAGDNLSEETVEQLKEISAKERHTHETSEGGRRTLPAEPTEMTVEQWLSEAQKPLFRSKRAARLAQLAELRLQLRPLLNSTEQSILPAALGDESMRSAISTVLTLAKSRRQGTAIADLTVCGAIAPYNHLIGGKLVAVLAGSPQLVNAYRDRYEGTPSIIASSMAGRPVVKEANLVLISTTGLYGVRPSQYDRITVRASRVGGEGDERLRYKFLSERTEGWGTFQFSRATSGALQKLMRLKTGRTRITYAYGEGASPTMRLLREGLSLLGLDPTDLLVHGLKKSLYVFSLVRNPRRYLIGMDTEPDYLLPLDSAQEITAAIGNWWATRWASKRTDDDSLRTMEEEDLARPIQHSARVILPRAEEQIPLFGDTPYTRS